MHTHARTHTHTHTHPFNGPLSRTTRVTRYQKGKTNLKQETVSGSGGGISWAICKSAPRSRQTTTTAPPPLIFYRPDALPAAQPTASKHWRHISRHLYLIYLCTRTDPRLFTVTWCRWRVWSGCINRPCAIWTRSTATFRASSWRFAACTRTTRRRRSTASDCRKRRSSWSEDSSPPTSSSPDSARRSSGRSVGHGGRNVRWPRLPPALSPRESYGVYGFRTISPQLFVA